MYMPRPFCCKMTKIKSGKCKLHSTQRCQARENMQPVTSDKRGKTTGYKPKITGAKRLSCIFWGYTGVYHKEMVATAKLK